MGKWYCGERDIILTVGLSGSAGRQGTNQEKGEARSCPLLPGRTTDAHCPLAQFIGIAASG